MPYWMRLTSYGIGMHAGVIPKPGEAASHGCIRLPKPLAPILFEVVKEGTPVTITH
jgi:lipoprotein-anchoring transpeptidase ErfK/SrfK